MRQTAPPDITPANWPSRPRAASGEKTIGTSQVAILREPSLATVRRPASRPTCSASSNALTKRDEVQYEPLRFLPPSSSAIGWTYSDALVPRAEPENPAEVANAAAPTLRPNTAPSELVRRASDFKAADSAARARRIASATSRATTASSHRSSSGSSRAISSRAGRSPVGSGSARDASDTVSRAKRSIAAGVKSEV